MSTSASGNAMRDQLDELDALLQRMLTLPVNELPESDGGVPSEPAVNPSPKARAKPNAAPSSIDASSTAPRVDKPSPPAARRGPMIVFQSLSRPSALSVAAAPAKDENAPASTPAAKPGPVAIASAPPLTNGWGPVSQSETPAAALVSPVEPEPPHVEEPSPFLERHQARLKRRRRTAPWLGPLGLVNRVFDRCVVAVGGPGLWLVRAEGRTVLGWLGLGLLAAAAVILAGDWFGWTW